MTAASAWRGRRSDRWTFRTQRIKGANGLWYRVECRCFVCRQRDGRLCENILTFIRSKPDYAHFELVPYE